MNDTERLEIVYAALNAEIDVKLIMQSIEKQIGRKAINRRWSAYFDDHRGTVEAIKADLKKS